MPIEEGALAYLTGGSHIGETANVRERIVKRSSKAYATIFDDFGTVSEYVFVIGKEKDLPLEAES